ncbi:MAG TPA: hypothetical protein VN026_03870 [Bacteroidia bacterium]|jgi:hypothetical protein|nr:hypothetical protein [Bacteroidia bacterium]
MQFKIRTGIRVALIVISLLSITKDFAQPMASLISDKIMKPQFEPILKQSEQKKRKVKFGFGLETYVSGNAHGAFYSARLNVSKGKSVFSLGPCLQKRTLELTGAKLGYSYLITEINDRYDEKELKEMKYKQRDILELRILCYVQYLHNASLSYAASRVETITNNNSGINFNQVRLSTVEAALCAEIDINIKWLKIRTYMGGTTFYHTTYINGMYREKCAPALIFGTGFVIPNI